MTHSKDYLTDVETSQYLESKGFPQAVGTLRNKRVKGGGPPFVKRCGKIRYRVKDVDSWLSKAEAVNSTSEYRR